MSVVRITLSEYREDPLSLPLLVIQRKFVRWRYIQSVSLECYTTCVPRVSCDDGHGGSEVCFCGIGVDAPFAYNLAHRALPLCEFLYPTLQTLHRHDAHLYLL